MEDIGDYIYLIIIAIAGLSGILKKKKKDIATQTAPPEEDLIEYEDSYEESPQEVFTPIVDSHPNVEDNKNVEQSRNHKLAHTEYSSYTTTVNSSELRSHKKVSRLEKSKAAIQDAENYDEYDEYKNDETELNIQLNSSFDAKLAFIYSEILNKRY